MTKLSKLLVSMCALAAFTCSYAVDDVIAKYNDKTITKAEVESIVRVMFNGKLPQDKKTFDDLDAGVKQQIISEVVQRRVLEDAVKSSAIAAQESYKNQLAVIQQGMAINLYLDRVVQDTITSGLIKAEYNDYVIAMKNNDELKVSHILVKTEKDANDIYDSVVRKKTTSFEDAAKQYSTDPSKGSNGLIGTISKGQMVPEFEKAAYSMKQGEISKPVQTTFGWHIIKINERKPRQIHTFDEMKPQMEQAAGMKIRQNKVSELIKKANVEIMPVK